MSLSLECCSRNTVQIIVELIVDFIWLVIVIAYALMTDACWLPDKGSVKRHRAINALWKSRELATKACYMIANPTPDSCISRASTPKECVASTNFFDHSYFCKASSLPTRTVRRCGLSDCPSACPKGITFVFFFVLGFAFLGALTGISLIAVYQPWVRRRQLFLYRV